MDLHIRLFSLLLLLMLSSGVHSKVLGCFDYSYSPLQVNGIDLEVGEVTPLTVDLLQAPEPGDIIRPCFRSMYVSREVTPSGEAVVIAIPAYFICMPEYFPVVTIDGNEVLLIDKAPLDPQNSCVSIPEYHSYYMVALNLPDGNYNARWIMYEGTPEEQVTSRQFRVGAPAIAPNSVPTFSVWAGILLTLLVGVIGVTHRNRRF